MKKLSQLYCISLLTRLNYSHSLRKVCAAWSACALVITCSSLPSNAADQPPPINTHGIGQGLDSAILKIWDGEPAAPPAPPEPAAAGPAESPSLAGETASRPAQGGINEFQKLGQGMDKVLQPGYKYKPVYPPSKKIASLAKPAAPKRPSTAAKDKHPKPAGDFDLDAILRTMRRERSLIDLKSIGELITEATRTVTNHPTDQISRLRLGSFYLLAGDYEGAAHEMKRAIALKPLDYRSHLLLARIYDDVGDHELAAPEYRRAIELASNNPEAHCAYGDSLMFQGEISGAINEFRRSIAAQVNSDALTGLADALFMAKDKIGSLKAARQAVTIDPSSARAHVSLTKALLLNGNELASMRTAREAVLLGPALADSHLALGRVLHSKGDLDGAVDEFHQAVTLEPLNPQARNDLGYALYSKGDPLSAVNEFRIALRLNPRLGEARNNLEVAIHALSRRKLDR